MATLNERGKRFSHLLSLELKGAISAYGFTTTAVAKELKIDYSTLARYFNGSRALPSSTLSDACEYIGAPADELVDRAYARLLTEMGPYKKPRALKPVENVSEPDRIFDPRDYGLAAAKDTRDEDTEQ